MNNLNSSRNVTPFPPSLETYRFISFASGSSGNCYYLGTKSRGILIDAGIGTRTLKKHMFEFGVSFSNIMAVLVTHDHTDHVRSIGAFGGKHNIPIYATEAVHNAISRSFHVRESLGGSARIVRKEEDFQVFEFNITPFEVPHDSFDNVGYRICFGGNIITIATDVGRITERIEHYAREAHLLVLESNYDEEMLQYGRYPAYLKNRISSGMGHLSNRQAADFVADIYSDHLNDVWLCHLSQDNNTPEKAYETTERRLSEIGVKVGSDLLVQTLHRGKPSKAKEFSCVTAPKSVWQSELELSIP